MTVLMHVLGWTLLHFLWQGTLLAVITALALWGLEGQTAACATPWPVRACS